MTGVEHVLPSPDRLLQLISTPLPLEYEVDALGPPRFLAPVQVEDALGMPICDGCRRGIMPRAHGHVRWGERDLHAVCAHDELLSLRSAA